MTDVEKLIKRVVAESGRKEQEIRAKMLERKEKTHGLLSDYGAIYAVARECGLDINEGETQITQVKDLKPSASVNIAGRTVAVYSEREFGRKDGSKGKFASVSIRDATGEVRVVLWDQNSAIIGRLRIGDVLLVKNGYVKDNRGQTEVHAGPLTNMTVNPQHLDAKIPKVEERVDDIGSLQKGMPQVTVVCRISSYFPKTEFKRSDGSIGSRASFIGEDETGSKRVVLWEPLSLMELAEGDVVKIENAYTREGLGQDIEIQAGSRSRIVRSERKLNLKPLPQKNDTTVKIGDIKPDMRGFNLDARVVQAGAPREYSKGSMASLIIGDASGTIRAVLWDERSKVAAQLKEGDLIKLKNVYSKAGMNKGAEVHAGKYSQVIQDQTIEVPSATAISEMMTEDKSIVDLDQTDKYVRIKGKIVAIEEKSLIYMSCNECGKRVQNLGGEWMCEEDGVVEGAPNMVASIVVEDKTGNIRAVAFKDKAERILGMDVEEAMNMMGETQDENAPLNLARERIIGKDVTLLGRVNYNDYSDALEFVVNDVS